MLTVFVLFAALLAGLPGPATAHPVCHIHGVKPPPEISFATSEASKYPLEWCDYDVLCGQTGLCWTKPGRETVFEDPEDRWACLRDPRRRKMAAPGSMSMFEDGEEVEEEEEMVVVDEADEVDDAGEAGDEDEE